jgi:hypothetical protein
LEETVAVCGLGCYESGAFLATEERDGDLMSNLYYWIREPKSPQAKRPEAYLWRMLEMRVW